MQGMKQPNPITAETLKRFLDAQGVIVAPGEDVTVVGSKYLADLAADAAATCDRFVCNPAEAKDQKILLLVAEQALRKNPFKNASGES